MPSVDGIAAVETGIGEAVCVPPLHVAPHVGAIARAEAAHRAPEAALFAHAGADERLDLLVHS